MNDTAGEVKVDDGFEWCVVEIFGHRQHVGKARQEERFGAKLLRIDELKIDRSGVDNWETLYYGGGSVFSYRPVTEEIARKAAIRYYAPPAITSRTSDEYECDEDGPY